MPQGGFLRTNYSKTGKDLDLTALGQGALKGSWAAGSGLENKWWGGFIMGSIAVETAAGYYQVSAQDALASYFGAAAATVGVNIIVCAINLQNYIGSVIIGQIFASCCECIINLVVRGLGGSAPTSCQSINLQWAGFIASGPW